MKQIAIIKHQIKWLKKTLMSRLLLIFRRRFHVCRLRKNARQGLVNRKWISLISRSGVRLAVYGEKLWLLSCAKGARDFRAICISRLVSRHSSRLRKSSLRLRLSRGKLKVAKAALTWCNLFSHLAPLESASNGLSRFSASAFGIDYRLCRFCVCKELWKRLGDRFVHSLKYSLRTWRILGPPRIDFTRAFGG